MNSSSASLLPSALLVPRQLCLDELLFDAAAGSAATAPPLACGSTLPSMGSGTCPALPPACGSTLPGSGCGVGPCAAAYLWFETAFEMRVWFGFVFGPLG